MKKMLTVFLTLCLLLSALVPAVSAQDAASPKLSQVLAAKTKELRPEDPINIAVWLRYEPLKDYGFSEADFGDPQDYITAKRAADKEYYLRQNTLCAEALTAQADVRVNYTSAYTPALFLTAAVSELSAIAALDAVAYLDYLSSEPLPAPTDGLNALYAAKFAAQIGLPQYDPAVHGGIQNGLYNNYEELYYHFSAQGAAPDWTLVQAEVYMDAPWEKIYYKKIGNRVLISERSGANSYPYNLGIYDAAADRFYDLDSRVVTADAYTGLDEALDALGLGYILGDANMDNIVDITDVTTIQRCLAKMSAPRGELYRPAVEMLGDVNGDGMNITDASILQRFFAHITDSYLS